jgi:heme/copper-type cytochrome/quinol oxidase subunit 2
MLIVLRQFLSDGKAIVISFSHNGIRGHFHALQPKTNEKEKINDITTTTTTKTIIIIIIIIITITTIIIITIIMLI